MRKKSLLLVLVLSVFMLGFLYNGASAVTIGGVNMPDTYKIDNQTLVLNGAGERTKFIFIRVYVGGLYVQKKSHNPAEIFKESLKVIRMHFTYPKISYDKIRDAFAEDLNNVSPGFANSKIAKEFINAFNFNVKKGDDIDLVFNKGTVTILYNGKQIAKFKSKELARNVLAIYIGKHPTQSGLKEDLLGK